MGKNIVDRETEVFNSGAETTERNLPGGDRVRCGKTGRYIMDDAGCVLTITSEKDIRLSPRYLEKLDLTFRISEKAMRGIVGSLKREYAIEKVEE